MKTVIQIWKSTFSSIFGRLCLVLFLALAAAHVLTLFWVLFERAQFGRNLMLSYIGQDVATSVAILDRVPAIERSQWLSKIERKDYRYILGSYAIASTEDHGIGRMIRESIGSSLGSSRIPEKAAVYQSEFGERIDLKIKLNDGNFVTLQIERPGLRISTTTALLLFIQLLILGVAAWFGVRAVVKPLESLALAADDLDLNKTSTPLEESGPSEVLRASRAFNRMRKRISEHLTQRLHILASVSHDLQTPITRMRLRTELLESEALKERLQNDLAELQALVEEGVAYARSAQASSEAARPVDLNALLDGLVCDYVDAGHQVRLDGVAPVPVIVRPIAIKRLVTNLLDNAIKFAGSAELSIQNVKENSLDLVIGDRGNGIPEQNLQLVLQPFYYPYKTLRLLRANRQRVRLQKVVLINYFN